MATTKDDLVAYVSALPGADTTFAEGCFEEAVAMVDGFIGSTPDQLLDGYEGAFGLYSVPAVIRDKCILQVGANLYHQKAAKNGIAGFTGDDTPVPVRVARDPMLDSYPLLRRFIPVGLA